MEDQVNKYNTIVGKMVLAAPKTPLDTIRDVLPQLQLAELVQLTTDIGVDIKQRVAEAKGAFDAYKRAARSGAEKRDNE